MELFNLNQVLNMINTNKYIIYTVESMYIGMLAFWQADKMSYKKMLRI